MNIKPLIDKNNIVFRNEELILPIYFPPPVRYYPEIAFATSIILANCRDPENWLYSHFIRTIFNKQNTFKFHIFPIWKDQYNNPLLISHSINDEILNSEKNILDIIKYWITKKYYIVCNINESLLPGTHLYKLKNNLLHPNFIYGIDHNNNLKILNYNTERTFTKIEIKAKDFVNAYHSKHVIIGKNQLKKNMNIQFEKRFILIKFNDINDIDYIYPEDNIYTELNCYFHSKKMILTNMLYYHYYNVSVWGIDTYIELIELLKNAQNRFLDIRIFHALWEHKKLMYHRLLYLSKIRPSISENIIIKYNEILEIANQSRMLSIKYTHTLDKKIIDKIINNLNYIMKLEKKTLGLII